MTTTNSILLGESVCACARTCVCVCLVPQRRRLASGEKANVWLPCVQACTNNWSSSCTITRRPVHEIFLVNVHNYQ